MPPPTVVCCVCGSEVLKSKTKCIGGDSKNPQRACVEHEETNKKAQDKQSTDFKMKLAKIREEEERSRRIQERHFGFFDIEETKMFAEWAWTHCWMCEREGIFLSEVFKLQLVSLERMKLLGLKWNPLSEKPEENGMKFISDMVAEHRFAVMQRFSINEEQFKTYLEWKNRIYHKCRMFIEMSKSIQLCNECQKRTGIVFNVKEVMPDLSLEQMAMMNFVYETSGLKEEITGLAVASIMTDHVKNVKNN
jgi:hypothetical protein